MTKTFCDRCGADNYVFKVENPIRQGVLDYLTDVKQHAWPDECYDKYADCENGVFVFNVELCRGCSIDLARQLVGFMEAHKS